VAQGDKVLQIMEIQGASNNNRLWLKQKSPRNF